MTMDPNLVALAAAQTLGVLATIKRDGRPQLSTVTFAFDSAAAIARVSVVKGRAKVHNLRRDARASLHVSSADGWSYAVLEGTVELSPVALAPDDDVVEALVAVYRAIRGEEHPNWDEFRTAMVAEHRLVAKLCVERAYGLAGAQ